MILKYILPIIVAYSALAFANNSAPCGPPGAYASVGETADQLLADCGQPASTQQYDQPNPNQGEKVVWYYVANALEDTDQAPMNAITQGARYSVEFVDGKVNLIYANAANQQGPYEAYNLCGQIAPNARQEVKRGDTMEMVRNRCGDPTFTEVESAGTPQPPTRVIVYTYTFDPTVPNTVVTVSNGVVTNVKLE